MITPAQYQTKYVSIFNKIWTCKLYDTLEIRDLVTGPALSPYTGVLQDSGSNVTTEFSLPPTGVGFDIDLVFISSDNRVRQIARNLITEGANVNVSARYAMAVNAGETAGIYDNDPVVISDQPPVSPPTNGIDINQLVPLMMVMVMMSVMMKTIE